MPQNKELTMLVLGDIILGDDSEKYVEAVGDELRRADIRIGQLEVPYTERNEVVKGLSREPYRLEPLCGCMDIVTLSGNHLFDAGEEGVEDTIRWLDAHGILHTGTGMNLSEARQPVIFEKDGVKIGLLNYNCTGPKATYASDDRPGGAYIKIVTHYELGDIANPGGPPEIIETWPEAETLEWMCRDIQKLREKCDVLAVYFHKGIVHKPVKLADYETVVSHAAIDHGADVVFSSHSHILHGIELYKGKTIYHGLGNGIAWVPSLGPNYQFKHCMKNDVFDPQDWARKRIERFGFVPDPEYPTYPFHPDAVYTVFAKCRIKNGVLERTGCMPAIVGKDGATRVVKRQNGGERVLEYLRKITEMAGLNARFAWDLDEIVIEEG